MTQDDLLHFVCAKCEAHLAVDPNLAGVKGPCPSCGEDIIAPGKTKPVFAPGASSLEKVKKAVESKPAKPDIRTSTQKATKKVSTAPVTVRPARVNPKTGLTKAEEESREFGAVVKLLVLILLGLIAASVATYYFQEQIFDWRDQNFQEESPGNKEALS